MKTFKLSVVLLLLMFPLLSSAQFEGRWTGGGTSLAYVTEDGDTLFLIPTRFVLFGVEYDSSTIEDNDAWIYDLASNTFKLEAPPGAGGGEANTLGDMPGTGVGLAGTKTALECRVNRIYGTSGITVADSSDSVHILIVANAITDALVANDITCANYVLLSAVDDSADARITVALAANKTITGNWVNTDNPWAANEIVSTVIVEGENVTLLDGTNWRFLHTDGSGDVVEVALGADGTFLESNGASAAPAFRVLAAGDIPDISATYEVQLNNEAGLYAVLSDVADYVQGGEVNSIDSDMYVDDSIDDPHINWGSGANQVSLKDIDPTPDDWWTMTVDSANGLTADTTWFGRNDFGATITIDSIYVRSDEDDYGITFLECDYEGGNIQTVDAVTASTNGAGMYYITETTISHSSIEVGHQVGFPRPSSTHDALMFKVFFHYTRP